MWHLSLALAPSLCIRLATPDDLECIDALCGASIDSLLLPGLGPAQQTIMLECTPLDTNLVHVGTYYVALVGSAFAACVGWSRRSAFIRTRSQPGSRDLFLDPTTEADGIRMMYTHPDFVRFGLGSILLAGAEAAARLAGFRRAGLTATSVG